MRRSPEDTIAAISTPLGEGGIGIVRLSGKQAVPIAKRLFQSSIGLSLDTPGRRVFHGNILDTAGVHVDEVLLHVMRAPHTYTREDVVEINCHGGQGPLNAVLDRVLAEGARLARSGEFTERAFLNGRIDLVQAEAVMDRICARTDASLRAASAAAEGTLSRKIGEMKTILVDALARIEAAVDFPEEDLPYLVDSALQTQLTAARDHMLQLLETAEAGRLYREGASIAIAGRPNVGKSSLFNALLRDARAIVSAQPGTTRDRIEELISLGGIPVRLTDTAGMRITHDEVERIGVAIARETLKNADIVLFVVDASLPLNAEDETLAAELRELGRPVWVALNKQDLVGAVNLVTLPAWIDDFSGKTPLSATTSQGLSSLEEALSGLLLGGVATSAGEALISRAHQRDSLRRAAGSLAELLNHFDASPEFLSLDLRGALDALGEITGETTPDDILERIFSSFCIGK